MSEAMRRAATLLIAFGIALSALFALGTLIGLGRHGPRWDILAGLGIMLTLLAVLLILLRRLETDSGSPASHATHGERKPPRSVSGGVLAAAMFLVLIMGILLAAGARHLPTTVFGGLTLVVFGRDVKNAPRGTGLASRIVGTVARPRPLVPGPVIGLLGLGLYALGFTPSYLTPLDVAAFLAFALTADPRGAAPPRPPTDGG